MSSKKSGSCSILTQLGPLTLFTPSTMVNLPTLPSAQCPLPCNDCLVCVCVCVLCLQFTHNIFVIESYFGLKSMPWVTVNLSGESDYGLLLCDEG